MMDFDVIGAIRSGYSLDEVADHLAGEKKFDAVGARNSGYSDMEIISELTRVDPTADMSTYEKTMAGIGKGMMDTAAGVGQIFDNESANQYIEESEAYDSPLTDTTSGAVGQFIGAAAPALIVPGGVGASLATRIGTGAVAGGVIGASQPVYNDKNFWEQKAEQTGTGAALGGLLAPVGAGIARVIKPNAATGVSKSLANEGVLLTPGQAFGGPVKRIEDAATSIPLFGDVIIAAKNGSIRDFNKAALNRVLAPLGKKLNSDSPIGHEGIDSVGTTLSKAYDDVLDKIGHVQIDSQATKSFANLTDLTKYLPDQQVKIFDKVILNKVIGKMTASGRMTAQAMKEIDSELGAFAARYGKALDADQRGLADAFREAKSIIRQTVQRSTPKHAKELRNIDKAYSMLLRVESASGRSASDAGGIFTPAQLSNAAKAMDNSVRKRAFARGKAPMQDLAKAGAQSLPSKMADSGTTSRAMVGGAALGAGAMVEPMTLLATALGASLYTKPMQKAIMTMALKRPALAGNLADMVRRASIPAGAAAVPALVNQ